MRMETYYSHILSGNVQTAGADGDTVTLEDISALHYKTNNLDNKRPLQ